MIFAVLLLQLLIPTGLVLLLFLLRRRFRWRLVKRYASQISGHIDICEKYNGEKVLMTNYFVQGISIEHPSIKKSYWYRVAEAILIHSKRKKNVRVLFIGLGANTSSLLINQKDTSIHQVIVEIDPLIIQACRVYFQLYALQNADIIQADIFDVLQKKKSAWKETFDSIVIDTFDANPPYMLQGSHDPEFLRQLLSWLKADGMFLFNIPLKTKGKDIPSLLSYLATVFKKQSQEIIHDPRGYRNHVITASVKK
jgi:spermidine synthase